MTTPAAEHPLDALWRPRATAIVGVSSQTGTGGRPGGGFLQSLMEQGYHERHGLYPVNPKMTEVEASSATPRSSTAPTPSTT